MSDYKTEAEPKAWAGEIPVFCAHDAIADAATLVPNPKNPNTHPDSQIQLLGRIIRQTGWRQPITVSKRSGFIVKGHGRLSAALLEGMEQVPVDYQNYTTEAEEYADLVADNRIAELAEIDNKMLADIFADIDTGEIPLELTGYTDDEVESLVTALAEALHEDEKEENEDPDQAVTQKDDLWILGPHCILCGEANNERHKRLLEKFETDQEDPQNEKATIRATISVTDMKAASIFVGWLNEEKIGRVSLIMETEPGFVDVIVRRYIKTTGKTTGIQLIRGGKEVARDEYERLLH